MFKEYIKWCIFSKKSMKKEIERLDKVTKQLYEITAGQQLMFDEYSDESYKTKFKEEHKKLKEYEKESREIIQEFSNAVNELEKENKMLKKELEKWKQKD